jgi:hypothetical protein
MGFVRVVGGYVVAVIALGFAATVLSSVMVLAMLETVGAEIGAGQAMSQIGDDLAGFGPLYSALIALALAVAFMGAALVTRVLRPLRLVIFTMA